MSAPRIRPIVICVFHHQGRILVSKEYDPVKKQSFYRPLGGGIEFGETSAQAVAREIREELGLEVVELNYLGSLDSIFTYLGKPGHEIVQIFDGEFADREVYQQPHLNGREGDWELFQAFWLDRSHFTPSTPLYPDGLLELLLARSML